MRCVGCTLAGMAAVGLAPVLGGCDFTIVNEGTRVPGNGGRTIEVDVSSLTADGAMLVTTERGPDRKPIVVVRKSAGTFRAMSTECSHSSFTVAPDGEHLRCTGGGIHISRFDLDGKPIDGPAVPFGPLKAYSSTYDAARGVLKINLG